MKPKTPPGAVKLKKQYLKQRADSLFRAIFS